MNFFCPTCLKDMFGAREIREFAEDGEVYFEADCWRCGLQCRLYLDQVP